MDNPSVRDAISNAVSKAVSEALSKAMAPSSGESSRGSTSATSVRKRTPSGFLPSSFLKKKCKAEGKGKAKKKTWTKDIVCLPADCKPADENRIVLPKGLKRVELAGQGLVGKISLHSHMDAEEVLAEVRSVFKDAMGGSATFQFKFLQLVGGGCRTLFDPQTSSSFEWTAKDVAQSAGRGAIYILAEDELALPEQPTVEEPELLYR